MSDTPLYIDFETRSPVDLKKAGLGRYAQHPQTEVLCLAFAFGDEHIVLNESLPAKPDGRMIPCDSDDVQRVFEHVRAGGLVVAHNAQFELAIWNSVMVPRFGYPRLSAEQTRCTMAACYAQSLPGALENAAHALGLKISKDTEGRALMLKLCKPRASNPDGTHVYHGTPEQFARLGEYCKQDVAVEREIYKRVLPLSDKEQRIWVLDQAINNRGVPFDMESLAAALVVADKEKERLNDEMAKVTDGAVTACSNVGSLKEWAADFGVMPDSLAKAEVSELLEYEDIPEAVKAALKLRQSAGRFTSISKLKAIREREIANRVQFLFQYHAATTGRWAGRGVQPHNFTRDLPGAHEVEDILRLIREGSVRWLDMSYGEPSIMISKCLRGFIKAAKGNKLIGGDYSNVEGRGLAWLAGEEWKLQAYREYDAGLGPDLYCVAYGKSFNVDPATIDKKDPRRQIGKVQELAFGYQGGVGAARKMAPKDTRDKSDAELDSWKTNWRQAHPRVKQYWYDLQDAAINAVLEPGTIFKAGAAGREVMFRKRGSFLWCRLPSGRTLCYPYPDVRSGDFGQYLTFKSVPDATVWAIYSNWLQFGKAAGQPNTTYIVDEPGNSREWCRISTYGGKLAENITQAICRDLLADAMLRLEPAGFPICLHVHDELVSEGRYTEADRVRFEEIMCQVPDWARDFPVSAGCWLSERYIKE